MADSKWYRKADEVTSRLEGGWYDGSGSHDPNPTMYGVTQDTYNRYRTGRGLPLRTVRSIDEQERRDIYRAYWDAVRGDELPGPVAIAVFDHAVNAGPKQAVRVLQRAAGLIGPGVDGLFGPKTLKAVQTWDTLEMEQYLFTRVLMERLGFYRGLAAPMGSKHRPSLLSWVSRLVSIYSQAEAEAW